MLKKLIKKRFDIWVRMRWLKTIEKETDKRNKLYEKYNRQQYVVSNLVQEFCALYPDTKLKGANNEQREAEQ